MIKKIILVILVINIVIINFNTSFAAEVNNLKSKEISVFSYKQMVEDYDYIWKILNENYPWWGAIERLKIDKDKIYNKYYKKINNIKSSFEFATLISDMTNELENMGHLSLLNSERYFDMLQTYDNDYLEDWFKVLNNDTSKKIYTLLKPDFDSLNTKTNSNENKKTKNNISTKIIEKNNIAYVKIKDFIGNLEKDGKKLLNFYKSISKYQNLIIDITGNTGGRDEYWMDYIVAPNIDKPLIQKMLFLYRSGEYNKNFISLKDNGFKPISKFPKTLKAPAEDLKYATHFLDNLTKQIDPKYNKKLFNGNIFVLVDDKIYSSSESFSIFCKGTGFATLVGRNTGGDGGGMTPILVSLPNSGLIVRFTILEYINSDGTNNEECGTTPDIISKDGEKALTTCLNYIKKTK